MTTKKIKTIYWISLVLTCLWFAASGFLELTKNPAVWDLTLKLGYPAYFIYLLGVAKIVGAKVLLIPGKFLRLKEWVFAGLFFDIIFAFVSKVSVFGLPATGDAIVAFILVLITYVMFRKVQASENQSFSIA